MKRVLFGWLILAGAGCVSESQNAPAATEVRYSERAERAQPSLAAFYQDLHQDADTWGYEEGNWTEDFGDGAAFGAFYFSNLQTTSPDATTEKRAQEIFSYNWGVVEAAASDLNWALDNLEEVFMAVQGVIEAAPVLGKTEELGALDTFIDTIMDPIVAGLGNYVELDAGDFASDLYGPTSLTAGVAVIYSQYALRIPGEIGAKRLERAIAILDAIHEKVWDDELGFYQFRPGETKQYLYPNGTMLIALNRVYELTGEQRFLDRAQDVFVGIQPLRKDLAYYQSPYSQDYQGAETDEYGTLSAQNYLMLGLLLLHQNTGEEAILNEVIAMLQFVFQKLYIPEVDKIVHHWIDGRPALESDPDYFCSGCNLQVLYLLWFIENESGVDLSTV